MYVLIITIQSHYVSAKNKTKLHAIPDLNHQEVFKWFNLCSLDLLSIATAS